MAMLAFLAAAWLFFLSLANAHPDLNHCLEPSREIARQRGSEIFNAVHDAMRQWGSSVHHNGMSFFLATVPEGVLLHHGNNQRESPTGPDWLAYEIEHAESFARGGRPPGSRGPRHGESLRHGGDVDIPHLTPPRLSDGQNPISNGPAPRPSSNEGGWLHVYRTLRPLQFLYVDGMSAGKTKMGTLDTQDYLLRGLGSVEDDKPAPRDGPRPGHPKAGGPMGERERAIELCKQCQEWNLQGVIRMEAGFEIIKCDFPDGLEQVQVLKRPDPDRQGHGRGELGSMEFIRGLSERYQGIGSSRTAIDYSSMVSAFFFPINLTNPDTDRPDLPRLSNTSDSDLATIRAYLENTINDRREESIRTIDWQDISDLIVSRYADRVLFLAEKVSSAAIMSEEINFLLDVFIDYSGKDLDISAVIDRCTNFFLQAITPITEADELLQEAFGSVTERICTTLFRVRELVAANETNHGSPPESSIKELKDLIEFLGWSRFKRCPACAVDEVCMIPMWPMGTIQDYNHPHCTNASGMRDGKSYWGNMPGPPGRGNGRRILPDHGSPWEAGLEL